MRHYSKRETEEKSGSPVLYTIGAVTLVAGGTLAYAKHDPDFRQQLAEYAPFTDNLIKFLFQEEKSIWENISKTIEDLKESVVVMFGGEGRPPRDIKEVPKDYKRKSAP